MKQGMKETMNKKDLLNLKRDLKNIMGINGEEELSWRFFHCMTEENRKEFEGALVEYNHPLAMEAGADFARFQRFILSDFPEWDRPSPDES